MNPAVLSKLLTAGSKGVAKEGASVEGKVLDNLLSYKRSNKELRAAIDNRIFERNPDLLTGGYEGALLSEGGSTAIPRLHIDDLKQFGYETEIPTRYKRRTGERDIDELAGFAGFDEAGGDRGIDGFLEQIMSTLESRRVARDRARELIEMRNDPKFIKETKKLLDDEKAYYAPPDKGYEPTKRDYDWYLKSVVMKDPVANPKKTGMENFKINWGDTGSGVSDESYKYLKNDKPVDKAPVVNTSKPKPIKRAVPVVNIPEMGSRFVPEDLSSPFEYNVLLNILGQSGLNTSNNM